jgi:hypothetical protein
VGSWDAGALIFVVMAASGCAETHVPEGSPDAAPPECVPSGEACDFGPCWVAEWGCDSDGEPACLPVEMLPPGAPCDVGLACDDMGMCTTCAEGVTCDAGMECVEAHIDCSSGTPVCVATGTYPDCPSPACGSACVSPDPCFSGVIDCSFGEPVCTRAEPSPVGTPCGATSYCDGMGNCETECIAGAACDTGSPCHSGRTDCTTGAVLCAFIETLPEGTPCGVSGVCDARGQCSECIPGAACYPTECSIGFYDCDGDPPGCTTFDHTFPEGTPCGDGGTCSPLGLCRE